MADETHPAGLRLRIVVWGAILIFASVVTGFAASELFYTIRPAQVWGDRITILIPFVPLTALTILVAASAWTRRLRASLSESLFALLPIELLALTIVVVLMRDFALDTFVVWALANMIFAPWWLLGSWIGKVTDRTAGSLN